MSVLIANLSTGKGTWGHVSRLIKEGSFDKSFLITNEFGKDNFRSQSEDVEHIIIDVRKPIKDLADDIKNALKGKFSDKEANVNLISGTGKEHMAILSALTQDGIKYKFIALTKNGIEEV